ncbi:RNA-directed DNA polymerase, eukaryota [Tanacetum coccineum]|uniref:RNA-directed DNA polymerase, eukaryota n=1 Tax=Tanacetum coccineum TaxID=301880 RepID=A0ABQ5DPK9_9ASTR
MNCLSLNVQGLGSKAKKDWIKELNNKHKVNFLSVQETKLVVIPDMDSNHVVSDNFDALYGSWVSNHAINVYCGVNICPQSITSKLFASGAIFRPLSAVADGHCLCFISNSGSIEIQLEGYSFYLVSSVGICLDRHLSDHRPILLREVVTNYGPSPFQVYHSWFSLQGFDQMVSETWNNIDLDDNNKMVRFKKKLQILKKEIRSWVNDCKKNQSGRLVDLRI